MTRSIADWRLARASRQLDATAEELRTRVVHICRARAALLEAVSDLRGARLAYEAAERAVLQLTADGERVA